MSKRVLVTGASGGIGGALCDYLEERGHSVLYHARRRDQAEKACEGTARTPVWGDLTVAGEVDALAQQVKEAGALDILIHNAGILTTTKQKGPSGVGMNADVNVIAPLRLSLALADHMMASSDGPQIIVVSSTAANLARNNDYAALAEPDGSSLFGHYAISKSAANALVLAMARHWPQVAVYSTEPGFVKTKMTATNSSMPTPMRWMANIVAATPQKAAARCLDTIFSRNLPSGAVIQNGKEVDSVKKKWGSDVARENLDALLSKAGLAV